MSFKDSAAFFFDPCTRWNSSLIFSPKTLWQDVSSGQANSPTGAILFCVNLWSLPLQLCSQSTSFFFSDVSNKRVFLNQQGGINDPDLVPSKRRQKCMLLYCVRKNSPLLFSLHLNLLMGNIICLLLSMFHLRTHSHAFFEPSLRCYWLFDCAPFTLSIHSVNLSDPHLAPLRLFHSCWKISCPSWVPKGSTADQCLCRRKQNFHMEFSPALELFGTRFRVFFFWFKPQRRWLSAKRTESRSTLVCGVSNCENPSGCAPVRPTNVFKAQTQVYEKKRDCINN